MTGADLDTVLAINKLNTGDVGPLAADQLAGLLSDSRIALVAVEPEGALVGFCLVIEATCGHQSPRSSWAFAAAAPDLHLERVAFDMQYSGFGLGLALYDELDAQLDEFAAAAPAGELTFTSLVRLEPPNAHSIGFHASRGFETVDQAVFDGVTVGVAIKTFSG
jgi:predicted GNAT superfamily acetyltransferase